MQIEETVSQSAASGGKATFALISRLLAEMLTDGGKSLVITAKAEEFIYDATFSIPVAGPLTFEVLDTHGAETGRGAEFSMTGEIAGARLLYCEFSFYFFIRSSELSFSRVMANMALLKGKRRLLSVVDSPATLHDSLFDLDVKRQASCGGCNLEGRGYLLMSLRSNGKEYGHLT